MPHHRRPPPRPGRRAVLAGLAAAALPRGAVPAQGAAPSWPSRPVRVVVPFAPGGASDFVARILQPALGELLGQPVVVENRAGAAGNVGMEAAARAAPDGYTLFLGNVGTLAVNPTVFARTIRVRPQADFAPISLAGDTPDVLVVHPSVPATTVAELVALARAQPGRLNYGSPGAGSLNRLEMELFREAAVPGGGLDMVHVPYPGGAGPAVAAIVAGDTQLMFTTLPSALGQVQAGRLRALAVTTARRVPALPEVPTLAESGVPDFVAGSWQGVLAPAGTPAELILRAHAATVAAVARPEVAQRLRGGGVEPVASRSPDEFADLIAREAERWGALARRAGATVE
jgi:tripartite-type tricarboxylate transporter receptor subunit TctC